MKITKVDTTLKVIIFFQNSLLYIPFEVLNLKINRINKYIHTSICLSILRGGGLMSGFLREGGGLGVHRLPKLFFKQVKTG